MIEKRQEINFLKERHLEGIEAILYRISFHLYLCYWKNLQAFMYLLVLEKMKNAEPAGIGSFLFAVLYSDILRGRADISCPSSKREFDFLFT